MCTNILPANISVVSSNICISLQQTRDPQLQLSLEGHFHVFSVSASGIRRYITLVQPLDRETQDSYTFTVL